MTSRRFAALHPDRIERRSHRWYHPFTTRSTHNQLFQVAIVASTIGAQERSKVNGRSAEGCGRPAAKGQIEVEQQKFDAAIKDLNQTQLESFNVNRLCDELRVQRSSKTSFNAARAAW